MDQVILEHLLLAINNNVVTVFALPSAL